jgi:hypothetical protein
LVLPAFSALACAGQRLEPQVVTSAGQTNYALDYPAMVQAINNDYVNGEGEVRRLTSGFSKYPEQLKDPPWPLVTTIVDRADEAGRSEAYVAARRELDITGRFFTQERDDITRRVAGSAKDVLKKSEKNDQGQCDADVSGAVASSLKEAVDRVSEKRLRSHDEAHFVIERNRETLGRATAGALEKQADEISSASYLVYIRAGELRARILGLIDEAGQVRNTLDRSTADERALQAQAGRSAAEKRASNERVAKMEATKVRIDAAVPQLQAIAREIDQRNDALRKEYADAFGTLKKALAAKSAAK